MRRHERHVLEAGLAAADSASRAAVDGMAKVMIEQIHGACTELQRVDELLGNAIEQLMSAFNSVSEKAVGYQTSLACEVRQAMGTPDGQRLQAVAQKVAKDVNGVVTGLQFRDVVGQKLGHVRKELENLELVMQQIRAVSADQAGLTASPGPVELAAQVQELLQELEKARVASPVRQELMHAGEIELF